METRDLLRDAFERIRKSTHATVEGLDLDDVGFRADDEANTIAWLIWHLTRVQDHHVAELADRPQVWTTDGWNGRFGTDPDEDNTGFGHSPDQVGAVVPDAISSLLDYHDAVHDATLEYLETLDADDLDAVIDRSWDPPVTVGVRLVSVINDTMQHAGQAGYVRGLVERAR
jgi:uncharacterized damage-inducible protein DinB